MHPRLSEHRTLNEGHAKQPAEINDFTSNQRVGQPLELHNMGSLKNPPVLWFQETRRIIEATAPAPRLAMAASVVRDSMTWPQSSISHETAQFGRFTNLHVMPRISKNEAPPNALRTRQPQPKPPGNEIFWSLSGTSTAPPPHYVDFSITSPHANRLRCTVWQLLHSLSPVSLHFS